MAEINDLNVTDASNTARFPENQSPSSVNDGARALEGLLARWHKDTNATIAAGGTGDAITVAANQTISAYYDGLVIAFEATAANTTATTLNVDSVGAKAIRKNFNLALVANDIKNGQKVICIFDSSADYWQMISHLGNQTVSGPASSTADSLAKWNGTTGGLLKDGAVIGTDVLGVAMDGTPDTDHTSTGPTTNTFASSGSTTVMDLVYLNSSSEWALTDADAAATAGPVKLAISLETKTAGQAMKVALPGSFVRDDTWNWTPGAVLYVSETAGQISASVPTGVDGIVRIVGHAVTADVIFFNPSDDYVTIDASGTIKNVTGIAPAAVSSKFKQMVSTGTSAVATGTTTTPHDDTIPQNTEGVAISVDTAITPSSAANRLLIEAVWFGANSAVGTLTLALFQDTTANALAAVSHVPTNADNSAVMKLTHEMAAGTTSATTFKVRVGSESAGTLTTNGISGGRKFGGVASTRLTVMEIEP